MSGSVQKIIDSIICPIEDNAIKKQMALVLAIIQLSEEISKEVRIDGLEKYTKVLEHLENPNKALIISSIMYTATKIANNVESNIESLKKLVIDSQFLLEFDSSFLNSYKKLLESFEELKYEFDNLPEKKKLQISELEDFKEFFVSGLNQDYKLDINEINTLFEADKLSALPISSDTQLTKVKDIVADYNRQVYIYLAEAIINGENTKVLVKKNRLKTSNDEVERMKLEKEKLRLKSQCFFMLKLHEIEHVPKSYGIYNTKESEFTLVMEYCGPDLSWHIMNTWMKTPSDSLGILKKAIEQLIPGMVSINNRDIAHRDIKPENIFYCEKSDKFKIGDFDVSMKISRTFGGNTIQCDTNHIVGTYPFISPEIRIYKDKILEIDAAAEFRLKSLKKKLNKAKEKEKIQTTITNHDQYIRNIKEGFKLRLNINKSDVFSLGLTLLCILRPETYNFWNSQMKVRSKYNYLGMIGKKIDELKMKTEQELKVLKKLIKENQEPSKSIEESELMAELQQNIDIELNSAFKSQDQLSLALKNFLGCMLKINPEKRENFQTLNRMLREQLGSTDTFYD